jgi:molecular chaperone GrpE
VASAVPSSPIKARTPPVLPVSGGPPARPPLDRPVQRTITAAERGASAAALLEGIRLVEAQFLRVLSGFGLERVSTVGARFDPAVHDAVAVVPVADSAQDGLVIDELEPAYRFGDRIVRPAKVQVGRAAERAPV